MAYEMHYISAIICPPLLTALQSLLLLDATMYETLDSHCHDNSYDCHVKYMHEHKYTHTLLHNVNEHRYKY